MPTKNGAPEYGYSSSSCFLHNSAVESELSQALLILGGAHLPDGVAINQVWNGEWVSDYCELSFTILRDPGVRNIPRPTLVRHRLWSHDVVAVGSENRRAAPLPRAPHSPPVGARKSSGFRYG